MDALDREILARLQDDGRLSLTELAHSVGLSVSPCHRRLAALRRDGVITGYRAGIDAQKVGLGFEAIVFVTMADTSGPMVEVFEEALGATTNIILAQRLFGTPDFLLRVVASDLSDYQRIYDEQLAVLPGVQRLVSTLVMKSVVDDRGLPL